MKTVIAFVAILFLFGCSAQPSQETVIEKNYTPERSWTQLVPTPEIVGEMQIITLKPTEQHQPETWSVTVSTVVEGVQQQRIVYVTKEAYDELAIGDTYTE